MLPEKVSHGPQNTPQLSPGSLPISIFSIAGFYGAVLFHPTLPQPDPHTIRVFVLLFWGCSAHHVNHLRRTKKQNVHRSSSFVPCALLRFSWFRRHGDGIDNFFQFRFNSQKRCHRNVKRRQAAHDYKGQTFQLFVHNAHWTSSNCLRSVAGT